MGDRSFFAILVVGVMLITSGCLTSGGGGLGITIENNTDDTETIEIRVMTDTAEVLNESYSIPASSSQSLPIEPSEDTYTITVETATRSKTFEVNYSSEKTIVIRVENDGITIDRAVE